MGKFLSSRKSKAIVCTIILTALTAGIFLFACRSNYEPPEITGSYEDDMLWLYSGNDRFRTDMKTREKLVDAVEIDGMTYGEDKLTLNDSQYLGDEVLLSFNYYAESHTSPFDTPLGSCLIKHDLTTKLNTVV